MDADAEIDFLDLTSDAEVEAETAIEKLAAATSKTEDSIDASKWPLSYKPDASRFDSAQWWTHLLYRGPDDKPVTILYSRNKAQSEALANQFLDEPVLGFDMEWPWDSYKKHRLQDKIGLIQLACEDKIGLFHIGLHPGETPEELIALTLRKIIESPTIAKTGVAVLNADMARLTDFFKLKPQGAFELSHLHRLVTYGSRKPEMVTTKLVKLATLVETHLGLPLSKGPVRTSDWSKALNQKQKDYAAADAYAGFMLYHCMDAKRSTMDPVPPLPLLADKYLPKGSATSKTNPLRLEPTEEGATYTDFVSWFDTHHGSAPNASKPAAKAKRPITSKGNAAPATSTVEATAEHANKSGTRASATKTKAPLDAISQQMFDQLSERRKVLAAAEKVPAYKIVSNAVLEGLAKERPLTEADLLLVKGIGERTQEKYGADLLEVIQLFASLHEIQPATISMIPDTVGGASADAQATQEPSTPRRPARRIRSIGPAPDESPNSSPGFGSPLLRTPQLHTGISFTMAETNLDNRDSTAMDGDSSDVFHTPSSGPTPPLKRKRGEDTNPKIESFMATEQPQPPTTEMIIFRSKLDAYCKRVASLLKPRHIGPLVPSTTLDYIVSKPPRTKEELHQVPDISNLAAACLTVDKDLLATIAKFAAAAGQ